MKGLCHLLSGICHITGRRRKGKGLVAPFRYNDYCGPTKDPALIRDPAFILVIMLFSRPLNETRHLYKTSRNLRQYGNNYHYIRMQYSLCHVISSIKVTFPFVYYPILWHMHMYIYIHIRTYTLWDESICVHIYIHRYVVLCKYILI